MHSSRMRTARSLIVSPYLVVSHACPPGSNHMHAPPEQPRMPPQEQPHMPPGATMHTPPRSNDACPPGATTHDPPVNRMTNRCKNITLPQTSFAGGKNQSCSTCPKTHFGFRIFEIQRNFINRNFFL